MSSGIILIGPNNTHKDTVGKYLAKTLQLAFHDLSADRYRFRKNTGFDPAERAAIYQSQGFEGVLHYMAPFNAFVLEQALREYGPSVVKLDPLDTIFDHKALLTRVKVAMQGFDSIVQLLPSPDESKTIRLLEHQSRVTYKGMDWNEYFIRQPSNRRLAKHVIYNQAQTPTETATEIMGRLDRHSSDIFLLGPIGVGKTTVGKLLSSRLGIPQLTLDGIRKHYYAEIGYRESEEVEKRKNLGDEAVLDYWKQFDAHAIARALEEYPEHIIDFGAGQTVFESETELGKVEALFAPFPNVFLLLPARDTNKSVAVLNQRLQQRTSIKGVPLIPFLISHPSNIALASYTVYTEGKVPAQIGEEILQRANN